MHDRHPANSTATQKYDLYQIRVNSLKIYSGIEPVDVIIYDETESVVLLAEVKAAPLMTLALAVPIEVQTQLGDDGEPVPCSHSATDNTFVTLSNLHIIIPEIQNERWHNELISLGIKGSSSSSTWAYEQIDSIFA